MNEATHFLTGILIGRLIERKSNKKGFEFETFLIGIGALVPDFDYALSLIFPKIAHGVFSHTGIGALLYLSIFYLISLPIIIKLRGRNKKILLKLFGYMIIGVLSHLLLDSFTYYEGSYDAVHHMYFWPIWNFPVHINTMFPEASYTLRVWIEVLYTVIISVIFILRWILKHKNPLDFLIPSKWLKYENSEIDNNKNLKIARTYLLFIVICISLELLQSYG